MIYKNIICNFSHFKTIMNIYLSVMRLEGNAPKYKSVRAERLSDFYLFIYVFSLSFFYDKHIYLLNILLI